MKLEVIMVGEGIDQAIQRIDHVFSVEKDRWYYKFAFPLEDKEDIDHILMTLNCILPETIQILNTSIISEQSHLRLPYGYEISFVGSKIASSVEEKRITLKRGLSFGGFHPTTLMCIELLMEVVFKQKTIKKVLDLGTGSGVLAIMAKKLGLKDVYALDIDLQSCIEAKYNAQLNGHKDTIRIVCGNEQCIRNEFDLIMANIIFHTIKGLIRELVSMTKPSGYLIISGLLATGIGEFLELLGKDGLLTVKEKEGWGAILWQKE